MSDRADIAARAADGVVRVGSLRAVAGLDGAVDSVIRVVDRRRGAHDFDAMTRIGQLAARVEGAAGRSVNIELAVERVKLGGNGSLLCDALNALGARTAYLGAVEDDERAGEVHRRLRGFGERCERVIPFGSPALSDALEFEDGKIILGKTAGMHAVGWEAMLRACGGVEGLCGLLRGADLLALCNWTMLPGMEGVWEGLRDEALVRIPEGERPRVFVDLADPAKRSDADLERALELLASLNGVAPVCLGLNLSESKRAAAVLGGSAGDDLRDAAESVRRAVGLSCVATHSRRASACAEEGGGAWFEGPFVRRPKLSTGAGDHFNAGFCAGWALGLGCAERLAMGSAVAGWYVRHGDPPGAAQLDGFLRELPEAEREG